MGTRISRPSAVLALTGALSLVGAGALAAGSLTAHGGAQRLDGDRTQEVRRAIDGDSARNVILFIGDGMGDSEITIARNYLYGAAGELPGIDALPLTGQYTTYALDRSDGKPDYVTDSAASGSGWATGTKTYNGAISVDLAGQPQRTILEIARANGLRTGNVSTAEVQDATPAVLGSHVTSRNCKGPSATTSSCPTNALENGGAGSISEQFLDTRADLVLGGGAKYFDEKAAAGRWQGATLLDQAAERGYQVVTTADQLAAVSSAGSAAPLLGLFASGNFPVRWDGPLATPTGGTEAAVRCTENPEHTAELPTLAQMTDKAIDLLDTRGSKGFFLQVEGASIDKQDHAANPCGQIGETQDLDEAVQEAMEFAKKDGNTLVVVTADHAHSSQIVYPNTTTPGLTRTLLTADDKPMTVAYGTAPAGGSQDHTGSQVRIAAYGPRAANVVGLSDQTDLFFTMRDALRLDPDAQLPGMPQIRRVSVGEGDTLHGRTTIRAWLDVAAAKTSMQLLDGDGTVAADNAGSGSTDGRYPKLTVDTRPLANGAYTLRITVMATDGRTSEESIGVRVSNRH